MLDSETVVIRDATPDEYLAISELTVHAYEDGGHLDTEQSYRRTLADVAGRASAGEVLVAVEGGAVVETGAAVEGGAVLGAVLLVRAGSAYAEMAGPGEVEFRMLAVSPKAQRRGIGERLVRACLDRARAEGAERVVICARDFIQAPLRLYARMGFIRVPERDWSPMPGISLVALQFDL